MKNVVAMKFGLGAESSRPPACICARWCVYCSYVNRCHCVVGSYSALVHLPHVDQIQVSHPLRFLDTMCSFDLEVPRNRATARCRDAQHGDGVCCAFASQLAPYVIVRITTTSGLAEVAL